MYTLNVILVYLHDVGQFIQAPCLEAYRDGLHECGVLKLIDQVISNKC